MATRPEHINKNVHGVVAPDQAILRSSAQVEALTNESN
jgi:hypothetical protein